MTTKIPVELSSTPGIVDGSNATAITIDSSENVGIGVTSAYTGGKLSLNGGLVQPSGNQHVIGVYGTSGLQLIGTTGGDNIVGTMGSSEPLIFRTVSAERMRIDSSGKVGIGETSPETSLHIKNAGNSFLTLERSGTTGGTGKFGINMEGGSSQQTTMAYDDGGKLVIGRSSDPATQAGFSNDFVLDSSGKVGIGTSSNVSSPLTVQTDGSANSMSIIGRNNGTNDEAVISFYEYDGTTRNAYIIKEAGNLGFATGSGGSATEKMRITSDGHVTVPNQPSFMIGSMQSSAGNVWTSAHTFHNNGNHFNTSNGRFTAPIAGFYFFFHWGMLSTGTSTANADVYHRLNGTRTQAGTAYSGPSGDNYNHFSCSYIVQMAVNDYADVYWSTGAPYGTSDGRHGAFGGYLIG